MYKKLFTRSFCFFSNFILKVASIAGIILVSIIIGKQDASGTFNNYLPFEFPPRYFEQSSVRPVKLNEESGMDKFFNAYRFKKSLSIYPKRRIAIPTFFMIHRKRVNNNMDIQNVVEKDQVRNTRSDFWSNPYFLLHP
jgi:hypothetical protein